MFGKIVGFTYYFLLISSLVYNTIWFEFAIFSIMLAYPLRHYNDYLILQTEKNKNKIALLKCKTDLGNKNQLSR